MSICLPNRASAKQTIADEAAKRRFVPIAVIDLLSLEFRATVATDQSQLTIVSTRTGPADLILEKEILDGKDQIVRAELEVV